MHNLLGREPESLQDSPKPVAIGSSMAYGSLIAALGIGLFLAVPPARAEGIGLGRLRSQQGRQLGLCRHDRAHRRRQSGRRSGHEALGGLQHVQLHERQPDHRRQGQRPRSGARLPDELGRELGQHFVGPRYTYTRLSPDDPGNDDRGAKWGVKVQAGGEIVASPDFVVNAFAAYTTGTEAYWARLRLLYRFGSGLKTGPELIAHGNDVYRAGQVGWVLSGIKLAPSFEVGVKAGARRTKGESTEPYGGVEFVALF